MEEGLGRKRKRTPKRVGSNGNETRKRYSKEELIMLATWLAKNPLNGNQKGVQKNKESTIAYIRRMFKETALYDPSSMTDDSMRSVYKKIMLSYKKTLDWINNIHGQDVEDHKAREHAVLEMCPFFYILNKNGDLLQTPNTGFPVASDEVVLEIKKSPELLSNNNEESYTFDVNTTGIEEEDGPAAQVTLVHTPEDSSVTFRPSSVSLSRSKRPRYEDKMYNAFIVEIEKIKAANVLELAKIEAKSKTEIFKLKLEAKKEEEKMRLELFNQIMELQERMMMVIMAHLWEK